jgi:hypothetical protein
MFPVRFCSSLALSFVAGIVACSLSLPLAASASRHGAAPGARPEAGVRARFGRTAQSGSEPFRPFVVRAQKRSAQPAPPADLPEFIHNPLHLRRMAYATQPNANR